MSKLEAASGKEFDETFLRIFTEHHRMTVEMSEEESANGKEAEIIETADETIETADETIAKQTKEIEEMRSLRQDLTAAASDSSR